MTPQELRQDLRTLADEVRVRLHLAGMEAKDAWAKLEPKLVKYEHKLETATGKLAGEVEHVGEELRKQLRQLLGEVKDKDAGKS